MTPYFADDLVQLYHGDARDVLPQLLRAGVVADLLLTDPPYGISEEGSTARGPKGDRNRDFFEADRDLDEARVLAVDVAMLSGLLLAPSASVYWWTGHSVFGPLEEYYRARGWETRPIAWHKPNAPPPMPGCFPGGIELCLHAYRPARTWNGGTHHAHLRAAKLDRASKHDHPNEKPMPVLEPLILWSSTPQALVLDPFAGSGSTLIAARAIGRRAVGIEQDERWCRRAALRLEQAALPLGTVA